MSDLITLFNSTRRRRVTKENYIAPRHMRDKVIYCKEYPNGVYINRSGLIDESKVFEETNDDMIIEDMSDEDEQSEWEDCDFLNDDEISDDDYVENYDDEEDLEELKESTSLIQHRVNIEKKTNLENAKRQEFVEYCENLLAELYKHFPRVLLKASQEKSKNEFKIFDYNKIEIHRLTVRLTSDFVIRVKYKTTGETIHDTNIDNVVEFLNSK